ncbi:MAG: 5-formyltetrahydrofolate cyclo-ligase [Thermodesulfobacteriota bacterium]|nr:5-formyltetrahydrofolate cyclo-ligase [Thermodesulfobacteriota bacterium]
MDRNKLRKLILQKREALTPAERRSKSKAIIDNLWRIEQFARAGTIFSYVHFRSEVETLPLIGQALARQIRVSVPLTLVAESRLEAYEILNPAKELKPGYCRIPEPDPTQAKRIDPGEIEVVLLPGSVFDLRGGRLGYGGGYYDRFLDREAPRALRIGLAFELQVVDTVPLLAHDERIHYLVTEERIVVTTQVQGSKVHG